LPIFTPKNIFLNLNIDSRYNVKATVYMTLGRITSSLEETFFVIGLPDPRIPLPADEDLPKVRHWEQFLRGLHWLKL
jgi:hypothetical protein